MAIIFNDGSHELYSSFTGNKAWNDPGLLQLNPADEWDSKLIDTWNNETAINGLFSYEGARETHPFGPGKSKLTEYIAAEGTGVIVLKGLHQWLEMHRGVRYELHLTLGFERQLWHWTASYYQDTDKIRLTAKVTPGRQFSTVSHDGFEVVPSRNQARGRARRGNP